MEKKEATKLIRSSALSRDAKALLLEHLLPSARITAKPLPADSTDTSVRSYFGDLPHLPEGVAWPLWDNREYYDAKIAHYEEKYRKNPRLTGLRDLAANIRKNLPTGPVPLTFLAQLDLAELAAAVPLDGWPREGALAFFYREGWGFDPLERGHCRVLYCPPNTTLVPVTAHGKLENHGRQTLTFQREWTLPSRARDDWSESEYDTLRQQLRTDPFARLASIFHVSDDGMREPIHRCGGHPDEIQGEMRLQCQLVTNGIFCGDPGGYSDPRAKALEAGAQDWQLLLQLDSDDKAEGVGWMWGDCGRLYFWARQQDIAAGDFSGAWAILQCY